jgi:hypothetical protein
VEPRYAWDSAARSDDASPRRFFAETGHAVGGAFLGFLDHYGLAVCGYPISDVVVEDGVPTQYFQHLALAEVAPGRVRLKPLGEAWLTLQRQREQVARAAHLPRPEIVDLVASLARHPGRAYAQRPLADIRYLVLHHTGASRDVTARAIAAEHVNVNGWPGIGYHYVIDAEGTLFRTQDLTAVSYHARQFNPVAVGIALVGDLSATLPGSAQLERTGDLLASLVADLGLPPTAIRGHREMVPTACPGDTFLSVWKPRLVRAVESRLRGEAVVSQPTLLPGESVASQPTLLPGPPDRE